MEESIASLQATGRRRFELLMVEMQKDAARF
jgi:hypothetical protein